MFTNLRRTFGVALATLFLLGLAGCNTMEGVGKDVESAGEAIEEKAQGDDE
ncbi:entericidin A/B family lipoprotein [Arhodomonas sp. AD133]|uniref:entericidin A/B family lipoprotein n=1 Tax=Arhodomonas sp. AD133 TaxID=3415009 RepID=UPI003EBEBB57